MTFKFASSNIVVLRHIKVRPRLTAAAIFSCLVFFLLLPEHWRTVTKLLTAWDSGTFLYLILASIMMYSSGSSTIRDRAALQDEGSIIILGLTVCSAIASFGGHHGRACRHQKAWRHFYAACLAHWRHGCFNMVVYANDVCTSLYP